MKSFIFAAASFAAFATASGAVELRLALPEDEDLRAGLRAASLLETTITGEEEAERRDIIAAAQADYRRLLAVLFENGYFGPIISIQVDGVEATDLPVVGSDAPIESVRISVIKGQRFLFGEATIGPRFSDTELPEGFAPGQRAATEVLRETANVVVEAWRDRGYAKADLTEERIVANHEAGELDATLIVTPGPRVAFGGITVVGNEDVRERPIRRIVDLRKGVLYDPEEIRLAARRLQRTGAFRSVSIVEAE
ncbi:MAG: POTRA domain-containing protein, partial [Pseudomonadota bacterium]